MNNWVSMMLGASIGALLAFFLCRAWPIDWPWAVDTFLGQDDFVGSPLPADPVANGYRGTYNGLLVFNNVDKSLAAGLLPAGFELAPRQTSHLPDKHPVILLFGDQTDGISIAAGQLVIPPKNRVHYSEVILIVPFVRKTSWSTSDRWHNYVVRMYLDNVLPITGGVFYGYNKANAIIHWAGRNAVVRLPPAGPSGTPVMTGAFKWLGRSHSAAEAKNRLANFEDALGIMNTTVLGYRGLVCSHWHWDLDKARIHPAETSYTMQTEFRSDMRGWPALSPFESEANSAFVLRGVHWSLANPKTCLFSSLAEGSGAPSD